MSDLTISIGMDESGVTRGVESIRGALGGLQGVVQTAFGTALGIGIAGAAQKLGELAGSIVHTGIGFDAMKQQAEIAFGTMLGDGQKAKVFLDDLAKFAASTPFEFPELVSASKKLLAFGIDAKDIIPTMTNLGDLSAGLGVNVSDLADIYGKAKVQGRLFAEDINQLTGRGIPITAELAKQFGVAESEVRGLVEKGKIGFPQLEKAIKNLTGQGSKFGGMMEKQSKSFEGLLSTVKDTFAQVSGQIMQPFFDMMTEGLQWIVNFTSRPEFTAWVNTIADGVRNGLDAFRGMVDFFTGGDIQPLYDALTKIFGADIAGNLSDIAIFIQGIGEAIGKGDWHVFDSFLENVGFNAGPVGDFLTNMAQLIPQIGDALAKGDWGGQFWNWLTDPKDGAIGKAAAKLQEFAKGIGSFLTENGPKAWTQLTQWATDFWNWAQTQGGEGGIWTIGQARLFLLANTIANELETQWKKTIYPTLTNWAQSFFDWANSPEVNNNAQYAGVATGNALADGIIKGLENKKGSASDPNTIIGQIDAALKPIDTAIKAGDAIINAFLDQLVTTFKIRWTNEIAPMLRKMIAEGFTSLLTDYPILSMYNAGTAPIFSMPTKSDESMHNPTTLNMTVNLDGQPIYNVTGARLYGDITTIFTDAMNTYAQT